MKNVQKFIRHWSNLLPALALLIGLSTTSQACAFWFHQPEFPGEDLKRFSRK